MIIQIRKDRFKGRHIPGADGGNALHYGVRFFCRMALCALLAAGTALTPAARAEAVDAWAVAAQSLGVLAAYRATLASILSMGADVGAQVASEVQDVRKNGLDDNENDVRIVDGVMHQLTQGGDYALKANSLPFRWRVTNSADFNAACYPTDYISINRGLVRGLFCDEDELAAVLAHEMTHGIKQHSAKNYAQAVAQFYGMSFLNMDAGLMDWNKLAALANYSIAKNVTLPTEYEADEGGFYLMAGAGFNPGGGAAAMARMNHYLTYETQNILEYQDPADKGKDDFSDHPETELREKKLAQMMTDWSAGHVTVKDGKIVCIDGKELLAVTWTRDDYDNTIENAYYAAGALAKAFHEKDDLAAWGFTQRADGGYDFLDASRVNRVLQAFAADPATSARLYAFVADAYAAEDASGARTAMKEAEAARRQKVAVARQTAQEADAKAVKKMREAADAYSDYGMGRQALAQMERVFAARNMDNEAESYAIRGRAKAVAGDYEGALADADKACAMDAKNAYNFLNRADVRHMRGELAEALADCAAAKAVDEKNPYAPLMSAQIYDEMGETEKALAAYRDFYALRHDGVRRIPEEYLKTISPKDCCELYEKPRAEKEKARIEARAKAKKAKKQAARP